MSLMKNLQMLDRLLAELHPRWHLVVVLPGVWRSFLPPMRHEDVFYSGRWHIDADDRPGQGVHGEVDTKPAPFHSLWSTDAFAACVEGKARDLGRMKGGWVRPVFTVGAAPPAVSLPTVNAGGVKEAWGYYHHIGNGWAPFHDVEMCWGGGYAPPAVYPSAAGGGKERATPFYAHPLLVAQRLAAKLPARSAAGEGATLQNFLHCGEPYDAAPYTLDNVAALQITPSVAEMAQPLISHMRSIARRVRALYAQPPQPGVKPDEYGVLHLRMEADWVNVHLKTGNAFSPAVLEHVLPCLRHYELPAHVHPVVYVATGEEVTRAPWFKDWQRKVARHMTVLTRLDLRSTEVVGVGREELAALEEVVLSQADWFMGFNVATTFSWANWMSLSARGVKCEYLSDCPSVLGNKKVLCSPESCDVLMHP